MFTLFFPRKVQPVQATVFSLLMGVAVGCADKNQDDTGELPAEEADTDTDTDSDTDTDTDSDTDSDSDTDTGGDPAFEGLDEFMEEQIDEGMIPGMAAALVANGEVVWSGGYGWANIEEETEVTADTPFMLASVSKLVTGTALMQAVEYQDFTLDDPVNDLLSFEVDNPHVKDEEMTVLHLATHTSSIEDNWSVWGSLGDKDGLYTYGDSTLALGDFLEGYLVADGEWYSANKNYSSAEPGTAYSYSNIGAALAGHLLLETTGTEVDDHCDIEIFEPLGMNRSGWHLADHDKSQVAMPYIRQSGQWAAVGHFGYPDYPDGQLRSSANDMGRFLAAYANGGILDGERILEEETVEEMFTVQLPSVESTQGIFWYWSQYYGRSLIGHNGSDYGTATELFLDTDTGIGVVVLINTGWSAHSTTAITNIEKRLFEVGDSLLK